VSRTQEPVVSIVPGKTSKMFDMKSCSRKQANTELRILAADLVTETDKAVEDMVSSTLREKYPDYEYAILLPFTGSIISCRVAWLRLRLSMPSL